MKRAAVILSAVVLWSFGVVYLVALAIPPRPECPLPSAGATRLADGSLVQCIHFTAEGGVDMGLGKTGTVTR